MTLPSRRENSFVDLTLRLFLGVEVSLYSLSFELPLNTTIDKPFLFLIKDTLHDTLIFVGKVSRPEILDQEDEADQRG